MSFLPKPVNSYAGEDELRKLNGAAAANGNGNGEVNGEEEDEGEYRPPRASDKYKVGIIYPPKEIRTIVDKTAAHIAKSPTPDLLEGKIREHQKSDPKFAFLNDEDPYHQYYRYMIEKTREDAEDLAKNGGVASTPTPAPQKEKKDEVNAYEPKSLEFMVDLPGVTAMDLDILRLTALFHARRGRSFLSSLSTREGRNYQFDFLRPTHSLFGYYNRMVESYQKIMQPPPGQIETLVKEASDPNAKWTALEEGKNRSEWERGKRKRQDAQAKEKEEEATAMAAIDWQDFVVVETIEFTQNDMELELPPPTSVEKLKSMSMAEKRMASMVMEETGAGPTGGEAAAGQADEVEMEEEEDEEDEEARLQRIKAEQEQARAKEIQRAAMEQRGMKIKKDYVPKGIQRGANTATQKCPYCGQSIPENELSEHIRIELLDPKWKEQKRQLDLRRTQAQQLQQGADISASLRNLAEARTDIFGDEADEETRKKREEEELKKRREREKIVWDGHTSTAAKVSDTFQKTFSVEDQIKNIHSRIGVGSDAIPANAPGPQLGANAPASLVSRANLPPALAASLPSSNGGTIYSGATITAAPTGPSSREYITSGAPTYISSPGMPPSGASGPSVHPSRAAQMTGPPPSLAGQTHPRDEDEYPPQGAPAQNGQPVFKRPRIEKLPYGQLYNESDWINLHPEPITLAVQLPVMPDKPEWKMDGSVISIEDLPVATLFSTLRERIKRAVDADLPISRIKLDYNGKTMNNKATMASVNLDDGEMVVMSIRAK